MTETRTLQFDSPRSVQSLYANDLKLLKTLEDSLGVKVTTREGWVKLEGETEQVDRAQRVFEQLEQARQKGVDIHKHEFSYALNSVAESRADNLNDVVDVKITTSSRKAPIVARTLGQRNYVEAIQKNDIVFGIGPAGTGKTYLAVAMAVAALKKEQVSRIILTRPAVEAGEALGFLPGDLQEKIRSATCSTQRRSSAWSRARPSKWRRSPTCGDAPSPTRSSFSTKPKTRPRNKCSCF